MLMLIMFVSSSAFSLFPAYLLSSLLVDILLDSFFLSSFFLAFFPSFLAFLLTHEREREREQESTTKTSLVFSSSSSNIIRDKTEGNLPYLFSEICLFAISRKGIDR